MLLVLTYKCSMHCSHCMSNCDEQGKHMDRDTLLAAINWLQMNKADKVVLITGGEIFEHPNICEFLDIICSSINGMVGILTNGDILSKTKVYMDYVKSLKNQYGPKVFIQVTNDSRYYPTKFNDEQVKNIHSLGVQIDTVNGLYPQGRALVNHTNVEWQTIAPKCTNCRIMTKQGINTMEQLVNTLAMHNKYCTPVITPDGSIKIGESQLCPSVGNIYDSNQTLIQNIFNCKCKQCEIPLQILKSTRPAVYDLMF